MGSLKELHLNREERHHSSLADELGLTWEELSDLEYEVHARSSGEGLIYDYVVIFADDCDPSVLSRIDGLDADRSISVSPWVFERYFDEEYELGAITQNIDHEANFKRELEATQALQLTHISDREVRKLLLRQIFIAIIGAVEAFLSDQFISKTLSDDYYIQKYVSSHPELKQRKISVSEIYGAYRGLKETAKTLMVSTVYHKLPVVKEMYSATFSIEFPDITVLQKYVLIRHDLVHRNGKTKDGELVVVNDQLVDDLRSSAREFVANLVKAMRRDFDDDLPF